MNKIENNENVKLKKIVKIEGIGLIVIAICFVMLVILIRSKYRKIE